MLSTLLGWFRGIPHEIVVLIISVAPIAELRAAIPLGIGIYHLPLTFVFPAVVLANMIPAFFMLYLWDYLVEILGKHWPWLHQLLQKRYEKMQVQWDEKIEKYGPIALILFVAVPLPGSGIWSGALLAWIFGLERKKALLSLFAGVLLSGIIVTSLTYTGLRVF